MIKSRIIGVYMTEKSVPQKVISPARRRLMSLYIPGELVTFEDNEGEFSVWVQRINTWQEKECIQKSKTVRAPIIALKKDKSNPDRIQYEELLIRWGIYNKETRIAFLISPKVQQAQASAEARIAAEDEWADDDYLSTLQNAWNEELMEVYTSDNDNVEAKRVYDELLRYTNQVESAVEHLRKEYTAELEDIDDAEILDRVLDVLIESEADSVQMAEFRRWQIFYATRNPENHDELFFEDKSEVEMIHENVYNRLLDTYLDLSFDSMQGKE